VVVKLQDGRIRGVTGTGLIVAPDQFLIKDDVLGHGYQSGWFIPLCKVYFPVFDSLCVDLDQVVRNLPNARYAIETARRNGFVMAYLTSVKPTAKNWLTMPRRGCTTFLNMIAGKST
jgi:hypothetical protein